MTFVFEVNMFQEKDLSFFHVFVSLFFTFPVWSLLGSFWGCGWIDVEAWKRIWRRWPETWSIASHSRSRESGRSLTGNQLYHAISSKRFSNVSLVLSSQNSRGLASDEFKGFTSRKKRKKEKPPRFLSHAYR